MDGLKLKEVINRYRYYFESELIPSNKKSKISSYNYGRLEHCYSMLDKMEKFIIEGRREKVFRWLGFIQGYLWSMDIYSLNDLKNHNRP